MLSRLARAQWLRALHQPAGLSLAAPSLASMSSRVNHTPFFQPSRGLARKSRKKGPATGVSTSSERSARSGALDAAISQIQSQFGQGSLIRLGSSDTVANVQVVPTGSLALDAALGVGGLPRGRVVEIYGPESSGKTTLALHVVAEAQKLGGVAAFVDAEHALDAAYAERLGVDTDALWVSQPDNAEQALEITDTLIRSGGADVVVVDSVAALVPRSELEGEMGDHHMALQARLMSQALRKMTSHLSKANCLLIFINQIRHKVGVMFGSPEVTAGGNALKFYSSVRLDIRRIGPVKRGDAIVGNQVRVKVAKNKLAPPFRQAEFEISFGDGISRLGELVDIGVQMGVLQRSGAWYSFGDRQLAQGREKTKALFEEEPELAVEVEAQIREALVGSTKDDDDDEEGDELDGEAAGSSDEERK